jgi:hypothetical protein
MSAMVALRKQHRAVHRSEIVIECKERAVLTFRQSICEAIAEIERKPEACLGSDDSLRLIRRDEPYSIVEQPFLKFVREGRLAVTNEDEALS